MAPVTSVECSIIKFLDELVSDEPECFAQAFDGAHPDSSCCNLSCLGATQPKRVEGNGFVDVPLYNESIGGRSVSWWLDVEESLMQTIHVSRSRPRGITSGRVRQR